MFLTLMVFSVVAGGLLILMWEDSFCVGGTSGRVESVFSAAYGGALS